MKLHLDRWWENGLVFKIYLKLHFHTFQSIANYWWKLYSDQTRKTNTFKAIEKYRYGLWKTVSKHLKHGKIYQEYKKAF